MYPRAKLKGKNKQTNKQTLGEDQIPTISERKTFEHFFGALESLFIRFNPRCML